MNKALTLICITLAVGGHTVTNAQPAISISAGKVFLAGQIEVSGNFDTEENNLFSYKLVRPLKKGEKIATQMSDDQSWSVDKHSMQVGSKQTKYPILSMVKCSHGNCQVVMPAILKTKTDINAGAVLKSEGYQIETKRLIKAGESISVLLVGDSLLSIEATEGAKKGDEANPSFTVFKDNTKPNERTLAIEAWRIVVKHVGK